MPSTTYDSIGKLDLSSVYNRESPISYFSTLSTLGYCVPQNAKPAIRRLIDARRALRGQQASRIVDIGCSYGVNAALLKYDFSFEDLAAHYDAMRGSSRAALVREDSVFFSNPVDSDLEVIGIDTADRALKYALDVGVIDGGASIDLEAGGPPGTVREHLLTDADLVISTGCFGYISMRTLDRILDCSRASAPWMCHTVLRMFDFGDASMALAERGYVTEKLDGLVRQRRFASPEEHHHVLARLTRAGISPMGLETDGWYYAETYISRPAVDAQAVPLPLLMAETLQ